MTDIAVGTADSSSFTSSLVGLWDFSQAPGADGYPSIGAAGPSLRSDGTSELVTVEGGIRLGRGRWLRAISTRGSRLDIHGPEAAVTVVARLRRHLLDDDQRKASIPQPVPAEDLDLFLCEAVAGVWGETDRTRQYALFLNLRLFGGRDQVCGHISDTGGPSDGSRYCTSASVSPGRVEMGEWHQVAFSFDGDLITSFIDGILEHSDRNPFAFLGGVAGFGSEGADFTVGAVHRAGQMGNWLHADLGSLAVFDTALGSEDLRALSTVGIEGVQL
jgi:hypothetical protein